MSGFNCCFLTCIQVSQETGKVVWYLRLFKNFPQFVVIHMVKGFSVINETEIDVFLEFPCFLYDPTNIGNLISGSSASVRSILFLSFIVPIFAWNVPLISLIFFNRSPVFPILLFSSIYLHWSLRKAFLSLLAILRNSAFRWISFLFSFAFHFSSFHSFL